MANESMKHLSAYVPKHAVKKPFYYNCYYTVLFRKCQSTY